MNSISMVNWVERQRSQWALVLPHSTCCVTLSQALDNNRGPEWWGWFPWCLSESLCSSTTWTTRKAGRSTTGNKTKAMWCYMRHLPCRSVAHLHTLATRHPSKCVTVPYRPPGDITMLQSSDKSIKFNVSHGSEERVYQARWPHLQFPKS